MIPFDERFEHCGRDHDFPERGSIAFVVATDDIVFVEQLRKEMMGVSLGEAEKVGVFLLVLMNG